MVIGALSALGITLAAAALLGGPPARTDRYGDPLPPGAVARLGTVRLRHGGPVSSLAFSPDGKTLAAVDFGSVLGSAVCLWETASGRLLRRIDCPVEEHLHAVAFGADNYTLALAYRNSAARLLDLRSGRELRRLGGPADQPYWVRFSPDGRLLAYGGREVTPAVPDLRLAAAATNKGVRYLRGHSDNVLDAAFSPDGKMLASAGADKTIRLWEVATGKERQCLTGHAAAVVSVAFAPDGRALASSDDRTIRVWDVRAGKELRQLDLPAGEAFAPRLVFLPDGHTLAAANGQVLRFWDVATGERLWEQRTFLGSFIVALALARDGKTLACANGDGAIRLWDVATRRPLLATDGPGIGLDHAAFSADGRLATTGGWREPVRVWDVASGKLLYRLPHAGRGLFLPDGRTLVSGDHDDGNIRLWDVATDKELRRLPTPRPAAPALGGISALALSPDGKALATSGGGGLRLWDLPSGRAVHAFGGRSRRYPGRVTFSPDGKRVASVHEGAVRLWDAATGKRLHELRGHPKPVVNLAFAPDGRLLATGDDDNLLILWDVATGRIQQRERLQTTAPYLNIRLIVMTGSLQAMAFSADGRTLFSGGAMRDVIHAWEVATLRERYQLRGHRGPIVSLALSADGTRLLSTSNDGTALVWDVSGRRSP
jgi:WD40 repeat protein